MDKALKQRLVGAVVLIALAVIVLPMIFGGRPSSGPDARSIELPAEPPDLEFETRRFPVDPDSGPSPDRADETDTRTARADEMPPLPQPDAPTDRVALDPGETQAAIEDAVGSPADDTAEDSSEAPAEAADSDADEAEEPEALPDPAGEQMDTLVAALMEDEAEDSGTRYVVQVASFGDSENAVRLAGQLEDAGYDVLLDHVSSDTGQLNRVRVGPYGSESRAQVVAGDLSERFSGINPRIVDMQPDAAGPALASEDPLMRWVVQVGSFSSQDNANDLVARLRQAGLSAYDETVSTETSTTHRVRVGPYLDRDEALGVKGRIAQDMDIDGVVMSAD